MGFNYIQSTKNYKRHKLPLLLIVITTVFGAILSAININSSRNSSAHQTHLSQVVNTPITPILPKASTNYGLPVRLQIPKLKVDAHIIYVGVAKDGSMSVPTNVIDVGWYKYGALPGNSGTAVLAGHLDGLRGEPGVFSNLNELVAGDIITVTEDNDLVLTFIVRETRSYLQNEQPAEVFNSNSGSHLNLITCTGSWDSSEHRFAKRLVVFMDKAS